MLRRALLAVLPAAACSAPVALRLDVPSEGGGQALIVLFALQQGVEAHAVDLRPATAPDAIAVPYDGSYELEVAAMVYARAPVELGLTPGPLELAAPGAPSHPLPPQAALYEARLLGERAPSWRRVDALAAPLDALRLAGSPCASFDIIPLELSPGGGALAAALPGGAALLGTDLGALFRVDGGGNLTALRTVPSATVTSAYQPRPEAPSAQLLLGGARGTLYEGELVGEELRLTVLSTLSAGAIHHVVSAPSAGGTARYALSNSGGFHRYEAGSWTQLWDYPGESQGGGLAVVGDDQVLAVWPDSPDLLRATRGVAVPETLGAEVVGVRAVAQVPGVGTVVAAKGGRLFRHDGSTWEELPGSTFAVNVLALAPYAAGFVMGGVNGNFAQWTEGQFCPISMPSSAAVEHVVALGEDLILLQDGAPELDTGVTLLRRR